ncbi:MAG: Mth938-like domain-containing protein [Tateyamaria sp.]|nr:Mth938-like domain-containing protein [Tateyamaria sp.]MDG1420422.1 Mth938-like domain-containing protein [Tateyamaria sp.]MDG2378915.1 Mth938-like domain-containing protein [Tateyamaria sp.]
MRLNEITYTDAKPVEGYGPGFFRIGGLVIIGGVCTGPTGTHKWNGYDEPEPLLRLVKHIDVLFLGTGAEISHIPEDFRSILEEAGFALDVMASASAARTYNVLLSEGRRIALAMLPI